MIRLHFQRIPTYLEHPFRSGTVQSLNCLCVAVSAKKGFRRTGITLPMAIGTAKQPGIDGLGAIAEYGNYCLPSSTPHRHPLLVRKGLRLARQESRLITIKNQNNLPFGCVKATNTRLSTPDSH
jgi:hypothetical protein